MAAFEHVVRPRRMEACIALKGWVRAQRPLVARAHPLPALPLSFRQFAFVFSTRRDHLLAGTMVAVEVVSQP